LRKTIDHRTRSVEPVELVRRVVVQQKACDFEVVLQEGFDTPGVIVEKLFTMTPYESSRTTTSRKRSVLMLATASWSRTAAEMLIF
jgi:hypothetical protein